MMNSDIHTNLLDTKLKLLIIRVRTEHVRSWAELRMEIFFFLCLELPKLYLSCQYL